MATATDLVPAAQVAQAEQQKWLEWSNYHRALFGWQSPADTAMVNTWIGFFRRGNHQPEDLFAATDAVAGQTEKIYKREDHLAALQTHLHAARQRQALRRAQQQEPGHNERGVCAQCGDTGAVSVPLLRDIVGVGWTSRRTCAVWCTCWAGRQFHATRNAQGQSMMGIHEYTTRNPHWRRQKEDARDRDNEAELLRTEAVEAGPGGKGNFDLCRDRLLHTWGMVDGDKPARPGLATDGDGPKKSIDPTAARAAFEARGPWQKEQGKATTWDEEFKKHDLMPKPQPPKKGK